MYESHFGFIGSPFQLNPDPAFYFDSRGHSNALAYLKFGAHQGEGFIVVTGEIGAGKTTLVRTLLEGLNADQVVAAQVVSTQLESSELLQAILMAFGIPSSSTSKAHLIANLEGFLTALAAKGRRALLIIDEAQNLKHEAVEELRMLSNFQLGKYGLLQSFLVGQPELRSLLQSKSMEQLRQRVIASCHLGPLDQAETRAYVEHRLRRVGWKGISPEFSPGVLDRVHYWTGGVPRRINRLCNRLLLGAFLANASVISAAMVDETALELKNEIGETATGPFPPSTSAESTSPSTPVPSSLPSLRGEPLTSNAPVNADSGQSSTVGSANVVNADRLLPVGALTGESTEPHSAVTAAPQSPGAVSDTDFETVVPSLKVSFPSDPVPKVVRRIHQSMPFERPFICLVDSAADYLKAGVLAGMFRSFPSLPPVVAVHTGAESDLGIGDLDELQMPLPAAGMHMGILPDSYAIRTSKILTAYDELLTELEPSAVMVMGNSDAALACSLLTRKRGLRLLRTGSGKRNSQRELGSDSIAGLVEKISDVHYTDSTESFYALYREGIRLDRVHSVGSLSREMLDMALATMHGGQAAIGTVEGIDPSVLAHPYGLITIDHRARFVQSGDLTRAIELFGELSQELPLLWPMNPAGINHFELSAHAKDVKAARIFPIVSKGFRQSLALLQGATCLITRDEGPWLEEARLLGVSTLVLAPDLTPELAGALTESVHGEGWRAKFQQLLCSGTLTAQSPEYWDAGTARRIAKHLIGWLSPTTNTIPSAPHERAQPVLVAQ